MLIDHNLAQALRLLSPTQRNVLESLSSGLDRDQVGYAFGLTRREVAQIESAALRKIRTLLKRRARAGKRRRLSTC